MPFLKYMHLFHGLSCCRVTLQREYKRKQGEMKQEQRGVARGYVAPILLYAYIMGELVYPLAGSFREYIYIPSSQ